MQIVLIFDRSYVEGVFGEPIQRIIYDLGDASQLWDAFSDFVEFRLLYGEPPNLSGVEHILCNHAVQDYITPTCFEQVVRTILDEYKYSLERVISQLWVPLASGAELMVMGHWEYLLAQAPILQIEAK